MKIERGLPLLLTLALLGCAEPVDSCSEASSASEGARCDFDESCREFRDGPTNCGYVDRTCVDGRLRVSVIPFGCPTLPDAGSGCGAYEPPPAMTSTECRSDADCGGSGSCWAPGDTSAFYVAGFCPMECANDGDCAASQVCVELNQGSCSQCRERCTATSCSRWETCGDDGRCRPQRCDEGYACPIGSTCVPGGVDDVDAHGCTTVPCDDDDDCGCGACVFGSCALGPGRCEPPRP
ncbi:hypothetical protein [Sandaracinus amylolyticus]|uniref:Tryptophan synthase alpha chain n=1 Tax=Sandaracinus amylolyticus TaxID=927083 RepID=A0A0F6YMI9_9BACT|nr:hypothetical protein [Sandaracinus amylolyticus]AKF11407.1 Tryptophan synthase alpha chain [Sandaracinus amylolyticus]